MRLGITAAVVLSLVAILVGILWFSSYQYGGIQVTSPSQQARPEDVKPPDIAIANNVGQPAVGQSNGTFIAAKLGIKRSELERDSNVTLTVLTQDILSSNPKLAKVLDGFEGKYADWYRLCKHQIEQFGQLFGSCANARPDLETISIASDEFYAIMNLLKPRGPLESLTGEKGEINRHYYTDVVYNGTRYVVTVSSAWRVP